MAKLKSSDLNRYTCDRCEWTGSISGLIRLDSAHCPGCGYDGTLNVKSADNAQEKIALLEAENERLKRELESPSLETLTTTHERLDRENNALRQRLEGVREVLEGPMKRSMDTLSECGELWVSDDTVPLIKGYRQALALLNETNGTETDNGKTS